MKLGIRPLGMYDFSLLMLVDEWQVCIFNYLLLFSYESENVKGYSCDLTLICNSCQNLLMYIKFTKNQLALKNVLVIEVCSYLYNLYKQTLFLFLLTVITQKLMQHKQKY